MFVDFIFLLSEQAWCLALKKKRCLEVNAIRTGLEPRNAIEGEAPVHPDDDVGLVQELEPDAGPDHRLLRFKGPWI